MNSVNLRAGPVSASYIDRGTADPIKEAAVLP